MKLQNKDNFDLKVVGIYNQYIANDDGSFFVNHPCILVPEQTLVPDTTYLLITGFNPEGMSYTVVKFTDCYHDDVLLHVLFIDVNTNQSLRVTIDLNETKSQCPWLLLDESVLQLFVDIMAEKLEVYN